HPTPDQHGTGDRLGLFLDKTGEIWGIPLTLASNGAVMGCAPPTLRESKSTDTYPAASTVIGTTNEPTGWRAGTGRIELVLRAPNGDLEWRSVTGGRLTAGAVCWAQE